MLIIYHIKKNGLNIEVAYLKINGVSMELTGEKKIQMAVRLGQNDGENIIRKKTKKRTGNINLLTRI